MLVCEVAVAQGKATALMGYGIDIDFLVGPWEPSAPFLSHP